MSQDMTYLVWAVALTFIQLGLAVIGANTKVALPVLVGNRETLPPIEGWAGRAIRAHRNMLESLILFAIMVLVAAATGRANGKTALGAEIFFWARAAYAVIYIIGIPWIRTLAWLASAAGLVIIFLQLV